MNINQEFENLMQGILYEIDHFFRYIMFSRYWNEIVVIGILPLLALITLNYGIYLKIRKSAKFRKLNDGFAMRFAVKRTNETALNCVQSSIEPLNPGIDNRSAMSNPVTNSQFQELQIKPSGDDLVQKSTESLSNVKANLNIGNETSPSSNVPVVAPPSSNSNQGTKVLVGIVLIFLICHVFRLVLQVSYNHSMQFTISQVYQIVQNNFRCMHILGFAICTNLQMV